jgi:hypothetical protein
MRLIISFIFTAILAFASADYGPNSAVISATEKSFKDDVSKHDGSVIDEFYAPWCGHVSKY